MKINGIDVSHHQGVIDWEKVIVNGTIKFAILRIGYSKKDGKGGLNLDRQFYRNIRECNRLGLPVGIYVYCYDDSPAASKITCDAICEILAPFKIEYPVIYDIEYENNAGLRNDVNDETIIAAMKSFETHGYYGMVYASRDFFLHHVSLKNLIAYDKWEAAYTQKDTPAVPNGLWQWTSRASVPGINGPVDGDIAYKDYPGLIRKAGLNHLAETKAFEVKPTSPVLRIRSGAGTNYTPTGKYTGSNVQIITEVRAGEGSNSGWGKLQNGAGWIALDHCTRL